MKFAVRTIDRALKRLYQLDSAFRAEAFLLEAPIVSERQAANRNMRGILYVRSDSPGGGDLRLGIFFTESVRKELANFWRWEKGNWTQDQWCAFLVTAEEVSHFHYVVHRATRKQQVSQLELEIQGEIDKFALAYFANLPHCGDAKRLYDEVFKRVFEDFSLHADLTQAQSARYQEANHIARKWLKSSRAPVTPSKQRSLERLREFYALDATSKLSP